MNSNQLAMSGFFEEVKRRKVYRVAVAYIIAAGGIIQLASAAFPAWELPNWSLRLVIAVLLLGFPIALILAWAFDITSEGIVATPTAAPQRQVRRNVIVLAAAGLAISAAAGFFVLPRAIAYKIDKSIAVLPFENLSDDKENAYFADGVQDDILTNLSKIGDLKVISRTSVMPYRTKPSTVREIGKALGVSSILEGSVRRSGNRVRVNVQLIDATNDKHIWAQDYDRELVDVFAIQTDLAQKIAGELQAKLSPAEKENMQRKPTENGEAYLAFVRAHDLHTSSYEDMDKLKEAEKLYARAIELDPKFALAYARYSYLESWMGREHDETRERPEKARGLAQHALELQPDLPEAHLAMGFSYYYGDNNYEAALNEFQIARRGLPNEAETYLAIGAIQRRQGKWDESNASLEKAAELGPNDWWVLQNLAHNYIMLRRFDDANQVVDRALKINGKGYGLWELKINIAISARGDLSLCQKALEKAKTLPLRPEERLKTSGARIDLLLLERNYQEALNLAESIPDEALKSIAESMSGKYLVIGVTKKLLGDAAGANTALLQAKQLCEEELKQKSDSPEAHIQLAKIMALLGERDGALAEAQRAMELRPESKDAFDGPKTTKDVAEIHSLLGDADQAIDMLDGLLSRPSPVTVATLKINPIWDPLRNNPRFQALLTKYGAKA